MKKNETTEQIELFTWAKRLEKWIPELSLMYHVPNEGKRTNGAVLKAAGLKTGVPDICLPVARKGFNALYIEMKFGNNKPTKAQKEYISNLRKEGNKAEITYGADQAKEIIRHYLAKAENFDLINCEEAVKVFDKCEGFDEDWTPCKNCEIFKKGDLSC